MTEVVKCRCSYCQEGMSQTAEECVERMAEVGKRLRESLRKEVKKWKLLEGIG